jgi:hypothetical protein
VPNVASGFPAMAARRENEGVDFVRQPVVLKKSKGKQAKISHQEIILLSI